MDGFPIWYELMVPDPAKVAPFYKAVLGWDIPAAGNAMPNGSEYREIARAGGGPAGGVLTLTPEMADGGARPFWAIYFNVSDVDASVDQAKAMGASVLMEPMSMEGIGRMAMLADPQGAPFYVMTPVPPASDPDAQSDVFRSDTPGHAAWNELNTQAASEQIEFYTTLFDWQIGEEMPMSGDDFYSFLMLGETGIGAVSPVKPDDMPSAWMVYFRVADIDAAKSVVEANGGSVMLGPQEVPNDDYIIVASDPAGATLGLVGRRV
ncbi:VOC family protein [Aurantiacibacter poecillastricola]|uniref:VOC family protein n=1 Tax=Aurantiacibacter poecillastricola TaxID=3064385 RepID=UPI00273EDB30|nr:VOC family protein [Aurantiacibacter sp. 219JJ12-13]MDP5262520.1 VOC family protein [Aurantiacibacter sp. 219JJ12-13]